MKAHRKTQRKIFALTALAFIELAPVILSGVVMGWEFQPPIYATLVWAVLVFASLGYANSVMISD
jgi:hypothetical protein